MQQTETEPDFTKGKFKNLKVLLAEDNEVNLLLAQSMLKYWGLNSKTAKTGNEVIRLMQTEDFDMVLMDIQMPEKSGIEAAEEIRSMADPFKRNVPIIALTANGVLGEEKKYIAAGMNAYLTKPFKENELYEVINRVLDKDSNRSKKMTNGHSLKSETIKITGDEPLYNLSILESMAEGNKDFILALTKVFIDTVPVTSIEMLQACGQNDWDVVSKRAHKLKATIDTMSIVSIKETIRTIETNAKLLKEIHLLPELVEKVNNVIHETVKQLKIDFSL